MSGMKVFTDTDSQFLARVFQPTAANLLMEPVQTTATNLQMTANQSAAANLQMEPIQTTATNLQMTANQSAAANLQMEPIQTTATNLQMTANQTTASNLRTTLANRGIKVDTATVNVTTTNFDFGTAVNVITLSQFSFFIKNSGTADSNIKIQLSPNGTDWLDDSTVTKTLVGNQSALSILTPTRFSRFVRFAYKMSNANQSTTLNIFEQGRV